MGKSSGRVTWANGTIPSSLYHVQFSQSVLSFLCCDISVRNNVISKYFCQLRVIQFQHFYSLVLTQTLLQHIVKEGCTWLPLRGKEPFFLNSSNFTEPWIAFLKAINHVLMSTLHRTKRTSCMNFCRWKSRGFRALRTFTKWQGHISETTLRR